MKATNGGRGGRYSPKMVRDARAMRANDFSYSDIASALNREHGTNVSWRTVADWCRQKYRRPKAA